MARTWGQLFIAVVPDVVFKLGALLFRSYYWYTRSRVMVTHPDEVLHIKSRGPGRTIKLHLYKSKSAPARSPILINFHGSGFAFPLHGADDEFCQLVAKNSEYSVIDIQYRLAPENPFPAAIHDMEDACRWVLEQPTHFDLPRVFICGFSAGGNLALVGASSSFPRGTFRSIITYYPVTDCHTDPWSKIQPDPTGPAIPPFMSCCFDRSYLCGVDSLKNPHVSPTFAPAENFPDNMLIITAAFDYLVPEAEQIAAEVKALPGRYVVCKRTEKCKHGFDWHPRPGTVEAKATEGFWGITLDICGVDSYLSFLLRRCLALSY